MNQPITCRYCLFQDKTLTFALCGRHVLYRAHRHSTTPSRNSYIHLQTTMLARFTITSTHIEQLNMVPNNCWVFYIDAVPGFWSGAYPEAGAHMICS